MILQSHYWIQDTQGYSLNDRIYVLFKCDSYVDLLIKQSNRFHNSHFVSAWK